MWGWRARQRRADDSDEESLMDITAGYISKDIGRQDLKGPAVVSIANAIDTNNAPRIDNDRWQSALTKNRALMDKIHDELFNE